MSLHLLQVSFVHVNPITMQQVLSESEWQDQLTKADLWALTPLKWWHINPYGAFTLNIHERLPLHLQIAHVRWTKIRSSLD